MQPLITCCLPPLLQAYVRKLGALVLEVVESGCKVEAAAAQAGGEVRLRLGRRGGGK